jgi:hypothetical protein
MEFGMTPPDRILASADRLRLRLLELIVARGGQGTLRRAAVAINVTLPAATKILAAVADIMGVRGSPPAPAANCCSRAA